jgi:hypothetical protein
MAARLGNEAGLTIASLLAEKNREALLQQVEAEKDPSLREFLEKVITCLHPKNVPKLSHTKRRDS